MKYKYISTVVISLFLILSCSNTNEGEFGLQKTIHPIGKPWGVQDYLGFVFTINASDDYLVLKNNNGDEKFMLANLRKRNDIHYFGRYGDGPKGVINPGSVIMEDNCVEVFDGGKRAFLKFPYDSICAGIPDPNGSQPINNTQALISIGKLKEGLYVSAGIFEEGNRLCLIDTPCGISTYHGGYPIDNVSDEIPFHVLGMAYQSNLCIRPDRKRIALATRYGGIVQLFEWNEAENVISEIKHTDGFEPRLYTSDMGGTPQFRPGKETRWGYINVDCTQDYVFALYSGKYQSKDEDFNRGSEVHVYDWDGNEVCKIVLDRNALCMAVNKSSMFIVEETEDGKNDIVEYKIKISK